MILYHYTCNHGRKGIGDRGGLLPLARLVRSHTTVPPQGYMVWLTDMESPDRNALGLTSNHLDCDRMQHRYRVTDRTLCERWGRIRSWFPELRHLELAPGAMPAHWWISTAEVPVVFDPITSAVAS